MINGKKSKFIKVAPVCLLTWATLGYIVPAQAAVVVDIRPNERPNVIANGNGSLTVNINSASADGVSHNKFTQFDVTKQGLVLNNNASGAAVSTQVAGNVATNSKLTTGGSAKLIINEVTTNRASQLNGQIEVASTKADVIVANPAGITCSGCGFINVGTNKLVAGSPIITDGKLIDYNVKNGKIIITGQGMNDQSDYTNLIASAVQIDRSAKLNAKDLTIATTTSGRVPNVGIDVAALGGMYADKITLKSGKINNDGFISANTSIDINVDGSLSNTGVINTKKDVNARIDLVAKSVSNDKGRIDSVGSVKIVSDGNITNSNGRITAAKAFTANSNNFSNRSGYITGESVSIVANQVENSYSDKYVDNPKIAKEGGIHATGDIGINASGTMLNNYGWINSDTGNVSVVTNGTMNMLGGQIGADKDILLSADRRLNASYLTATSNSGNISFFSNADTILNYSRINAKKDINVDSSLLDYAYARYPDPIDAKLTAGNDINIKAGTLGQFDRTTVLSAGHDVNLTSRDGMNTGTYTNAGVVTAGNNINFAHGNFVNNSTMIARNDINVKSSGSITNNSTIASFGSTTLSSERDVTNSRSGSITSFKTNVLKAPVVRNAGSITGLTTVSANKFTNTGNIPGFDGNVTPWAPEE